MKSFDEIEFVYYIDDYMTSLLFSIDSKLESLKINDNQKKSSLITKSKVRSIHSSLSIENNSLSLFDVEDIYKSKKVIGKRNEIQEVKNAFQLYNNINKYNYKNQNNFLKAHSIMLYGFEASGEYRNHGEGIIRNGVLIYSAPDSLIVPSMMNSLFKCLNNDNINKIILSCLFHYYLVYIHPFRDGNGRMARFWSNLILIDYNDKFEFIPIEEEIYLNKGKYYESIVESHFNLNANKFIIFMLEVINSSIDKVLINNNFCLNEIQSKIIDFIANNKKITQNEIAIKLNKNVRTIKRNFKILIYNNIIERVGSDKTGYWNIIRR